MPDALASALAAGATVVTPNRRLARHLIDEFDRGNRAAGMRAWVSPKVLPWPAFVAELEREALDAGALEPLSRLGELASLDLWRHAVDADGVPRLDAAGLSESASEAWDLMHAHGAGGEGWRAWKGGDDEPAAFARWAERYRAALADHRATDAASAAERIVRAAPSVPIRDGRHVALTGFVETTPQQRRVIEALTRTGAEVVELPMSREVASTPTRAAFATPDDEIRSALAWARRHQEARPEGRVGIVVPDLEARLAAARLAARDVLGAPRDDRGSRAAWNVSLGAPIGEAPVVRAALDLVTLAWSSLPIGRAAALIRSDHVPGAGGDARGRRARIERDWLESGVGRVRIGDAISALARQGDPLASRLGETREVARRIRRAMCRGWVDAWREALRAAGWPGDRPLSSDEHQAAGALDELLASFAAIDAVATTRGRGEITGDEAASALSGHAATTLFQPESPSAPIQILGLFEAIGLPFDALWIAGMSDDAWPRAPRPHPLLPVAWQRDRGVPRSDAARELAWAKAATDVFLRAAPTVVVSHATSVDDRPTSPSALFGGQREVAMVAPPTTSRRMFDARPTRERIVDPAAPALDATERPRAGANLIETESACPFQALAAARWRADPWPAPAIGLTPMERGVLVHATLEAFWQSAHDHASLFDLMAEPRRFATACDEAATAALAKFDEARWRRVPDAVRARESARLSRLLARWLDEVEKKRPPFKVIGTESRQTLALGPLALSLRLDRVDALADGGMAILDYKTSRRLPSVRQWTSERPQATQLSLYSLAWREAHPDANVRATVLAQVRPGECNATGLYADEAARFTPPSPRARTRTVVDDWRAHEARCDELVRGLADAFVRGDARVAPRDASACRTCMRHALCRIGDAATGDDEEGA